MVCEHVDTKRSEFICFITGDETFSLDFPFDQYARSKLGGVERYYTELIVVLSLLSLRSVDDDRCRTCSEFRNASDCLTNKNGVRIS